MVAKVIQICVHLCYGHVMIVTGRRLCTTKSLFPPFGFHILNGLEMDCKLFFVLFFSNKCGVRIRFAVTESGLNSNENHWPYQCGTCNSTFLGKLILRYDLPNEFTYLQLGRNFINLSYLNICHFKTIHRTTFLSFCNLFL